MSVLDSVRDFVATARVGLVEVVNHLTPRRASRDADYGFREFSPRDVAGDSELVEPDVGQRRTSHASMEEAPSLVLRSPETEHNSSDGASVGSAAGTPSSGCNNDASRDVTPNYFSPFFHPPRSAQRRPQNRSQAVSSSRVFGFGGKQFVDDADGLNSQNGDSSYRARGGYKATSSNDSRSSLSSSNPPKRFSVEGIGEKVSSPRYRANVFPFSRPASALDEFYRSDSLRRYSEKVAQRYSLTPRKTIYKNTAESVSQRNARAALSSELSTPGTGTERYTNGFYVSDSKSFTPHRYPYSNARPLFDDRRIWQTPRKAGNADLTVKNEADKVQSLPERSGFSATNNAVAANTVGATRLSRERSFLTSENTQPSSNLLSKRKRAAYDDEHDTGLKKIRTTVTNGLHRRHALSGEKERKDAVKDNGLTSANLPPEFAAKRLEEQRRISFESAALQAKIELLEKRAAPARYAGLSVLCSSRTASSPTMNSSENHGAITNAMENMSERTEVLTTSRVEKSPACATVLDVRRNMDGALSVFRREFPSGVIELFDNPLFKKKMLKANVQIEGASVFEDRRKERFKRLEEQERILQEIRTSSGLHQRRRIDEIGIEKFVEELRQASGGRPKAANSNMQSSRDVNGGGGNVDEPAPDMVLDFDYEHDFDPDWEEEDDFDAVTEAERGITVVDEASAYSPLTSCALKRLRKRMSEYGDGELVSINNIPIQLSDLHLLRPNVWLNDEIINGYMELIKDRSHRSFSESQARDNGFVDGHAGDRRESRRLPRVQIMTSFFYAKLFAIDRSKNCYTYDYTRVRRWTRKFDVFDYDMMLVPINQGNVHWTLGVINFRDKRVEYYDSMGGTNETVLKNLLQWVADELETKKGEILDRSEWSMVAHGRDVPQQTNTDDCGVFLCKFADFVSRDAPVNFSADHMKYFRARMAHELLMKRLA